MRTPFLYAVDPKVGAFVTLALAKASLSDVYLQVVQSPTVKLMVLRLLPLNDVSGWFRKLNPEPRNWRVCPSEILKSL